MASSASAMRPAALTRGTTPKARSRAVGCDGTSQTARSSARRPACVVRRQLLEAEPDDRPALAGHRREVRDGADGRDGRQSIGRDAVPLEQRGGELVRQTGAGEVGIGIGAIGAMRVDDRGGPRQDGARQVVVGDDDVQPDLSRQVHLRHVRDTAVAGDHEGHATRREVAQPRLGQAVALGEAGRERSGSDRRRRVAGR